MMDPNLTLQPVLALDIGGTKIAGGLVTPDGVVQRKKTIPTLAAEGGEAVMQRVLSLALEMVAEGTAENGLKPSAIGVGTGGQVSVDEGVIVHSTAVIPGWAGMPVGRRLAEATGLPVRVDNDANVMALGEAIFGAGKGYSLVVGITVGTGIGGGIILDQRIFHGAHGFSNHIGHMVVRYQGRTCLCGKRGCLEAYASGKAMASEFRRRVGKGSLRLDLGLDPENLGVKEISRLALSGHPEAAAVMEQGARYLGMGIASILNLLDPDIVVVGGGIAQCGEAYFNRIQETAHHQALEGMAATPIVPAKFMDSAGLVGAACLAWGKAY